MILLNLKSWFIKPQDPDIIMTRFCQTGSQAELGQLFNHFGNDIYHYLVSLSNTDTANDVSQKTWLKVMEKRHLYREQSSLKAWLFTIATNTLRDEIKAANKLISLEYQQLESLQTVELETENNLLKSYNHALLQLPFKQRESFILQQEGFSLAQIASITSEPQETVKTRLRYAKQQLKISLGVYNEI
ncbi:hypothetical protein PTUN_a1054 [Pseudoalteromonas tunicata]|uniref:RNA polymerase sigma-70 factor n=1 Tax=Pseudoalteromonas tunicata D2 TaxID=87626 RepID=A4CCF1_9GAMM|nr:RNA polymerase sigma factor [Pseudoalteromonas tunicata]ATC93749.1 hypothetical protein PTUN_a1054 [Pseudoalteromonas tunicata]EAR27244.1 RNA polymerase sigma-70 factor [Pseudoalteromonas tunicata D2]